MDILTPKRVIAGMVVVLVVAAVIDSCRRNQKLAMPEEVKAARVAFDKLDAALEIGVPYQEYNRLLIEAKTAVNAADRKLPYISNPKIIAGEEIAVWDDDLELQSAHKAMLDAMAAQFVWNTKIQGKRLWDTPEGSKIRWDNRFEASVTEDEVLQKLWYKAGSRARMFKNGTNVYAQ